MLFLEADPLGFSVLLGADLAGHTMTDAGVTRRLSRFAYRELALTLESWVATTKVVAASWNLLLRSGVDLGDDPRIGATAAAALALQNPNNGCVEAILSLMESSQ